MKKFALLALPAMAFALAVVILSAKRPGMTIEEWARLNIGA